jgi:hypothetical protein
VGDKVYQKGFFSLGRDFEEFNQLTRLLGRQGQWGNAQQGAFCHMGTVGLQHRIHS